MSTRLSSRPVGVNGYQTILRVLTAALPLVTGQGPTDLIGLFNLAFNLYKKVIDKADYYTGAYCSFKITPGCLVKQSPLLAKDAAKYSFPGYPISIKNISIVVHCTNKLGVSAGKWTAVFIPFLELHDNGHYTKMIENLNFDEIASMPYARTGPTYSDLRISYRMRDKTAYCARPRELTEPIGVLIVAWDIGAQDNMTSKPANSDFNCEVELYAGFMPHVIFGPQHRVTYDGNTFDPIALTDGKKVMVTHEDGRRYLEDIDWSYELVEKMDD